MTRRDDRKNDRTVKGRAPNAGRSLHEQPTKILDVRAPRDAGRTQRGIAAAQPVPVEPRAAEHKPVVNDGTRELLRRQPSAPRAPHPIERAGVAPPPAPERTNVPEPPPVAQHHRESPRDVADALAHFRRSDAAEKFRREHGSEPRKR